MSDKDVTPQDDGIAGVDEEPTDEQKQMAKLKEAIDVKSEEIGPLRRKLIVTVPRATIDERMGEQFDELRRDALVPGFRKGHAPVRLVEKRFGHDVGEQLKTQLISSGYMAAVEKEGLDTLGDPLFWTQVKEERGDGGRSVETEKLLEIDEAVDLLKFPKEGPLEFACEVELKPTFELPKLDKIPVKRPGLSIEDDDITREIERLTAMRGSYQPVEKGAVKKDDMLYVDYSMSVDGQVVESEDNTSMAARDMVIKGVPLQGFGEAVEGKKTGKSFAFEAEVPDDHKNIDVRGKKAKFDITIHEIKRLQVPPLDQEFLTSIGCESEQELRDALRDRMESEVDHAVQRDLREQIGTYLVDKTKMDVPEGLSQRQAERSIARRRIEMLQRGVPEAQIDKLMDELSVKARDQVIRDLKLFFILEKISDDREINIPEERFNAAIAEIARRSGKRFDRVRDELSKNNGLASLYIQLRDEQILTELLADAEISEAKSPKTKPAAKRTEKSGATKGSAAGKATTAKKSAPAAKKTPIAKQTAKTAVKKVAKSTVKKVAKKTAKKTGKKKS